MSSQVIFEGEGTSTPTPGLSTSRNQLLSINQSDQTAPSKSNQSVIVSRLKHQSNRYDAIYNQDSEQIAAKQTNHQS